MARVPVLRRIYLVAVDVVSRTLRDGYIHAGNIAYLALVTLLPLVVLITAVTVAIGNTEAGRYAITGILKALPANVAQLFEPVIEEVLEARTGNLLWVGALVALWTVTTFIETLRDIIHRAFEVPLSRNFLQYRLLSIAGTMAAMLLVLVAFVSQFLLLVAVKSIRLLFPLAPEIPGWLDLSRLLTPPFIFLSLWAVFKLLTPRSVPHAASWPGALVTTLAWIGGILLLGPALGGMGQMSLTYGALSGVMVALLFFYAVGFALVLGAELNAALARHRPPR
jgi:membrane protein